MAASSECNEPPTQGFLPGDLFGKVTKTVILDLKKGIPYFNRVLMQNGFFNKEDIAQNGEKFCVTDVYRGKDTRIADHMFIRVIVRGSVPEWMATRVRKDKYRFTIDVCIKNTSKAQVIDEELEVFAESVKNYLIRFGNLQPIIVDTEPQIRGFNAWTDEGVELNTEELTTTYRVASIQYYIDVMNSYMGTSTQDCSSCS